ncbi:MAG: nuclear transport factor 2 family protein [Parachlamydia sp.]|nr:nuclear transport factor 2 family protein [Parachlamydia sp.]
MSENNVVAALAYYQAVNEKDLSKAEKYLHPEIHLIGPMAELRGKEAVRNSIKGFMMLFEKQNMRAKFGSGDQVMLAFDLLCPAPIGLLRGAALMNFKDGLIVRQELFYDSKPVQMKKDEIFS